MARAPEKILALASSMRWEVGDGYREALVEAIYADAAGIAERSVTREDGPNRLSWEQTLDRLLTSRIFGFPIMLALLSLVFYLTIAGANLPSSMLAWLLVDQGHPLLKAAMSWAPWWLSGLLVDGIYLGVAWVIAVMLPPMAIFFPLFTLLEDFGYLPRVAFNLDRMFKAVGAHGKQALTMSMGFGCNAAGVVATRVIDSPRERLIAIITNNFALCNGRWPTQIIIAAIFIGGLAPAGLAGVLSAGAVVAIAVLGIVMTFVVSWALSSTVLRGEVSSFSLELPPYRPPRVLQTLYTSLIDRTLIILWRAVIFALPCGAAIWLICNIHLGGASLAHHIVSGLDGPGLFIGLNGVILLAYIVAIPANEIVVPTILMLTVMTGGMTGLGSGPGVMFEGPEGSVREILVGGGGWTLLTGINLMLFSLLHNPCSTTIYTIWKETRSVKWTLWASLLPVAMGLVVCFLVAQVWRLVS